MKPDLRFLLPSVLLLVGLALAPAAVGADEHTETDSAAAESGESRREAPSESSSPESGTSTAEAAVLERVAAEQGEPSESEYVRFVRDFNPQVLDENNKIEERTARYWYHLTYPTGTLPSRPWDRAREHVERHVPDAPPWEGEGLEPPGKGRGSKGGDGSRGEVESLAGEATVDPGTNVWVEFGPRPLDSTGTTNNAFQYGIVSGRLNAIVSDPTDRGDGAGDRAWLGFASGGLWRVDGIQAACPGGTCDPSSITVTSMWDDEDITTQAISAIEIDPTDPTGNTIYVGTGDWMAVDQFSAGVMKTTDAGATWTQLGGDVFTPFSEALPPSEANGGCVGCEGNRWNNQNVKAVEVDPNNSSTILVGTRYDLYVSHDTGTTWEICPFGNDYTDPERTSGGITAINRVSAIHLDDLGTSTRAWVAIGYLVDGNNQHNGLYSFTVPSSGCPAWPGDFTTYQSGLPALSGRGRIELAAWGDPAERVFYAQIQDATNFDNEGTYVLRPNVSSNWTFLTNSGPTAWDDCNGNASTTAQDWYDLHIVVDPADDKLVYVGHVDLFKGTVNGTYSGFTSNPENLTNVYASGGGFPPSSPCPSYGRVHPDQHSFDFVEGTNGQWILVGNDGGLYLNTNRGALDDWYTVSGAGDAISSNQFYAGQVGMNFAGVGGTHGNPADGKQWLLGGMQDNGCASWDSSRADLQWTARGWGGDGMWTAFDSLGGTETTGYWITESQGGNVNCSSTGADGPVSACSPNYSGSPDWSTPVFMDQLHCTDVQCSNVLVAGDYVYASTAYGTPSWTRASPLLPASTSAGSIVSVNMARTNHGGVVAGTDEGSFWWSSNVFSCSGTPNQSGFSCAANGSATWEEVDSGNSVLPNRVVSGVAFAPDTDQVAYAAVNGFSVNTPATPGHVFRAVRTGVNSWTVTDKSGNLPDVPFETVAVNPYNPNQVFAGGHFGFYYTDDVTAVSPTWFRYMEGPLPNAPIAHFSLDRGPQSAPLDSTTLAAFTYGRGVYAIKLPGAGESFCTGTNKPGNPDNLSVSSTIANQLDLAWDASPTGGVTDYRIYRATTPGGPYTLVGSTGGATSFSDTGLSGGTTYYYVVRAVKGTCESDPSNEASGTPFGECTAAPSFAGAQSVDQLAGGQGCGLRVAWEAGTSHCGGNLVYNVYRSTTPGFTPGPGNLLASCVADTFFDDTTLALDTIHQYIVRAEDGGAAGSGSCGVGIEEQNSVQKSGSVSSSGTQTLYSNDFSSDASDWVGIPFASGSGDSWQGIQSCPATSDVLRFGGGGCADDYGNNNFIGREPGGGSGFSVPSGATNTRLSFDHRWEFELGNQGGGRYYDGATLALSLDGSNYSIVPSGAFLSGPGYGGNVYTGQGGCPFGNSAGISVWGGTSSDYASDVMQTQVADLDLACDAITGGTGGCAGETIHLAWIGITDCGTTADGWFLDDVVITTDMAGGACSPAPSPVQFLTATGKSTEVTVEWLNPSSGNYSSTLLRTDPAAHPADPTGGTLLVDQADGIDGHGATIHSSLTNGEDYFYSAFVDGGSGVYSGRAVTKGYPVNTSGNLKWNFSTEAAALASPGHGSSFGVAGIFAPSNSRALHAMDAGAAGGVWPGGWAPMAMNAPAQGQPLVLPSSWSGLPHDAVFVASQDGYLYCVNASTGSGCSGWTNGRSADAFGLLQATPILYAGSTGTTSGARWLLVGSRDSAGAFYGLHAVEAANGGTAWSFTNTVGQGGDGAAVGIVSGSALADPGNEGAFFASRARSGGSANTVWALDLSSGAPQLAWAQALGDTDSAITRDSARDRILVGTNAGWIYSLSVADGAGIGRDLGDGSGKDFVYYDATRDRLLVATDTIVHAIPADLTIAGDDWTVTGLTAPTRPLLHFGTSRTYFGACGATCADGRLYEVDAADQWGTAKTYVVPGVGGLGAVIIDRSQSPALLHAGSRSGRVVAIEVPLP